MLQWQLEIAALTDLKSDFLSPSLRRSIAETEASYNDSMVAFCHVFPDQRTLTYKHTK